MLVTCKVILRTKCEYAYRVPDRACVAATRVEVCGWKAGTASSVYIPPLCLWFKLTISVITTSPVSYRIDIF